MDCKRKRQQRRRLCDDLQWQEDVQRLYQTLMSKSQSYSDDDDDDDQSQSRREYCLVKMIYRSPYIRRRGKFDEITIIEQQGVVFKGCVKDGDRLIFKSQWDGKRSKLKWKFYVNDVLEEEKIGCCQLRLMDRDQSKHLFQIEKILGGKPCYDCQFDDDENLEVSDVELEWDSSQKVNNRTMIEIISPTLSRSSSVLLEDVIQSVEDRPKEKSSALRVPPTNVNKAGSEGFPADISELETESDEDATDIVPSILQLSARRIYGPPQLSLADSLDSSSPHSRQSTITNERLFNPTVNRRQRITSQFNRTESVPSIVSSQYQSRPFIGQHEQETSTNMNTSTDIAMANDAVQLLLTRLGITPPEQSERTEIPPPREKGNVENFILIYLHPSYPDHSTLNRLRGLVNLVKIFDDSDDCLALINTIVHERILLIIGQSLHQDILSRIHELQQILAIYIQTDNDQSIDLPNEQSKVQGIYSTIDQISEQISLDMKRITRDLIIYLNISSNGLSMDRTVIYYLLLTELLLDPNEMKTDLKELISFSRQEYQDNEEELEIIHQFENDYHKNQAIFWFTRPCFLSKMLHKALRIAQPDILFRLRSFFFDLFTQIQRESTSQSLTVYLGQTIQRADLEDLEINRLTNDILIFPQFLFASTDFQRAIHIAQDLPLDNDDSIPVVIRIDLSEDFKYANLHSTRFTLDEDNDVLLNLGLMGQIIQIDKHDNPIAQIHLRGIKLEDEGNIQQILDVTRREIQGISAFVGMIKLMIQMNQQSSAEELVQNMSEDEILQSDVSFQGSIAASCHILAQLRRNQEDFQQALHLYLLSLNVFLRITSSKSIELSALYSNIGSMYFRLENYEKSQEFYQLALDTQLHSNTPDLFSVSSFTNSIGIIYTKQGKYPEAVVFFERTLKILQQCSEPHQAEIAATYEDLGDACIPQLKYDQALDSYNKSLRIHEELTPRNAQTIGALCQTIGNIYLKLGQSKDALKNLSKALENFEEILPTTHPTFALLYNNIGLMHYKEERYADALKCYSKTLEIAAISLPENHSLVGITLFNIALTYASEEKFDQAMEAIDKSTEQFRKTLPMDHPDVLENQKYIEFIRQKKVLKGIFEENSVSL